MPDIHHRGMTNSNFGIFQSSDYSDLTVRCGSEEFKIHRAIVCPRSKFFATACNGRFREAEISTIVLEEDDPATVYRMLIYLYNLDYDDDGDAASVQHYMASGTDVAISQAPTMATQLSEKRLLRHAKMLNNVAVCAIGQKYDIGELKELATAKFRNLLWLKGPTTALHDIIDAVFETTTITDPGLRNVVVEYCADYSAEIFGDDGLSSIISDHGDLGLALLREVDARALNRCRERKLLHRKLVTLKQGLWQMIQDASVTKTRVLRVKLDRLLRELRTTYDEIEI